MLQYKNEQESIFECILPKEVMELPEELAAVDKILDDERFFTPYREKFETKMGRPTIPVDTFHRLMYLKFRYKIGYEVLEREVTDSIKWKVFCKIPIHKKAPHSTTLIKLVQKYGEETIQEINQLLLKKYKEEKMIRGKKLRADTTVVEANIHYPTDAGILTDAIRVITRTMYKVKQIGKEKYKQIIKKAKKTLYGVSQILRARKKASKEKIKEFTQKIVRLTEEIVSEAKFGLEKLGKKILRKPVEITEKVLIQTKKVLKGIKSIPNRIVSIFDEGARGIKKGKLHKDIEFGRQLLVQQTESGVITGYEVLEKPTNDSKLIKKVLTSHKKTFGKSPQEATFDRGFSSKKNEEILAEAGVKRICMLRKGNKTKERLKFERQSWFIKLKRWRSGVEGKISHLKRSFSLGRTLSRGDIGARSWVGYGILAHNLKKAEVLI